MSYISVRALAGGVLSAALFLALALPASAQGFSNYYNGSSYYNNSNYDSYGYSPYDNYFGTAEYGSGGYGYNQQSSYQNYYQPYETYWGYTPYNLNPVYSNPPPYYYDPYYSPFTYQTGYYGSCNGQPCGGAFMPNSPYYGGFAFPPGASYY